MTIYDSQSLAGSGSGVVHSCQHERSKYKVRNVVLKRSAANFCLHFAVFYSTMLHVFDCHKFVLPLPYCEDCMPLFSSPESARKLAWAHVTSARFLPGGLNVVEECCHGSCNFA